MKHLEKQQLEFRSPEELKPNSWNPNSVDPINQQKLVNSIRTQGFFKPVVVRTLQDNTLEILGGEHRNEAAKELNLKQVPVFNLGKISDAEAKAITIKDNSSYGEMDFAKLGEILGAGELGDTEFILSEFPIDEDYLVNIFDHDFDDLDSIESEVEDETIDIEPEQKAPTKSHQIIRFKVPVTDAHIITDYVNRVKAAEGYTESDDLTNAGDALIHIFKEMKGDE